MANQPDPRLKLSVDRIQEASGLISRNLIRRSSTGNLQSLLTPRPITGIGSRIRIDITKVPPLNGIFNTIKFFNRKVEAVLQAAIRETQFPTIEQFNISIKNFCRLKIDEWFKYEYKPLEILSGDLVTEESPRAKEIWRMLQRSDVILGPLFERFVAMETALLNFIKKKNAKTLWTDQVVQYLNTLLSAETVSCVLEHLVNADKKWDPTIQKLGMLTLGDLKKDRLPMLQFLQRWVDPTTFHELRTDVRDGSHDNISAAKITQIVHPWKGSSIDKDNLTNISLSDVDRSLFTTCPLINPITVNGKLVTDIDSGQQNQRVFLIRLFRSISEAIGWNYTDAVIQQHVDIFNLFKSFKWGPLNEFLRSHESGPIDWKELKVFFDKIYSLNQHQHQHQEMWKWLQYLDTYYSYPETFLASILVPEIAIIQLMSNGCWAYADKSIRQRFPGIFSCPYWTHPIQGIECQIQLKNSAEFSVRQIKRYGVYYRVNRTDPECFIPDRHHVLAELTFEWTVTYTRLDIQGQLKLSNYKISKTTPLYDKWGILRSLINYEDDEDFSSFGGEIKKTNSLDSSTSSPRWSPREV